MRELTERYREDARQGRLSYQECPNCGHRQAFVRPFCSHCGGRDLQWKAAQGLGTVVAITTLHRAPTPDYRERVPYAIALVELVEGPRVMGHAAPGLTVAEGVTLSFAPHGERHLIKFDRLDGGR